MIPDEGMEIDFEYWKNEQSRLLAEMPHSSLRGLSWVPNMPSLVQVSKMKLRKVYLLLTKLPNSYYKGITLNEIVKKVSKADAYRYICELSLINAIAKSHLMHISEVGSE